MPASSVAFEENELSIELADLGVLYIGTLGNGKITGTFNQSGISIPLDLEPGVVEIPPRPQEPLPPFPYHSEEVRFENSEAGVVLAGTFTRPEPEGRYPAVILVTGSGPQNRDEEIFDHKPFLVIADRLTRNGIAVLRYDDRGTAQSTGSFAGSTSEDFAWDALAAFDYLRSRSDIDSARIGVLGHSEGGTIGFMMAARQPELGFVISMAGAILPGDSLLVLQCRDILLASGVDGLVVDRYVTALAAMYKIKNSTDPEYVRNNREEITALIPGLDGLPQFLRDDVEECLFNTDPWFNYFVNNDPRPDIESTRCPVLAVNGEKDIQVRGRENISRLEEILGTAGHPNFTTHLYPGLNHLFQECERGTVDEYGRIEQTISPQVLEDLTCWILQVTAGK